MILLSRQNLTAQFGLSYNVSGSESADSEQIGPGSMCKPSAKSKEYHDFRSSDIKKLPHHLTRSWDILVQIFQCEKSGLVAGKSEIKSLDLIENGDPYQKWQV
jgi:hypothetical protein